MIRAMSASCAAFGAGRYCAVLGKCGTAWARLAWRRMRGASRWYTGTGGVSGARGEVEKRMALLFQHPRIGAELHAHGVGMALFTADRISAESLTGGKLEATRCWGAVIHTTR